ncbi:cytochrome c-type biogenesis protein [Brevundimonas sp.]|uniref:cytochrome c-type biogenesis protein n=1 Tax=Brevundimonas sp. TaxID=1871086 RepID=UPI002FDB0F73
MRRALTIAAAVIVLSGGPAVAEPAVAPDRPLADAGQEARAQALFEGIRCVVCQHEAIADSPAGVASDMRRLVREEIAAGRSDTQIRAGLVERYGDYVLFKPPVRIGTWLLWFGPFALLLAAGSVLLLRGRKSASGETSPLSVDEERRLAERLADEDVTS